MHVVYRLVRRLFLVLAGPMFDFRVEGHERFPASGSAILVAPHRSWLDPAAIGGASPREVSFLILNSVYHRSWVRWFYRGMRAIPVSPDSKSSLQAMREALRRLRRGEWIGIFPEGRVFPRDRPGTMNPGAALLAIRSGAPVIPLNVRGSEDAWPHGRRWPGRGPVRVRVGSAIVPPNEPASGSAGALEQLMQRIELALDELERPRP